MTGSYNSLRPFFAGCFKSFSDGIFLEGAFWEEVGLMALKQKDINVKNGFEERREKLLRELKRERI